MIRLTDEEILRVFKEFGGFDLSLVELLSRDIAKAQLKKVVEYILDNGKAEGFGWTIYREAMQSLLEEVK